MTTRRLPVLSVFLVLSLGSPTSAFAHGQEILYFVGLWFLLVVGGLIALGAWKERMLLKLVLFLVLLGGIVLTGLEPPAWLPRWADPLDPHPLGIVVYVVGIPITLCMAAFFALRGVIGNRRADGA